MLEADRKKTIHRQFIFIFLLLVVTTKKLFDYKKSNYNPDAKANWLLVTVSNSKFYLPIYLSHINIYKYDKIKL